MVRSLLPNYRTETEILRDLFIRDKWPVGYSNHAEERMRERCIFDAAIRHTMKNGNVVEVDSGGKNEKFTVKYWSLDDENLSTVVAVAIDRGRSILKIVTVYEN